MPVDSQLLRWKRVGVALALVALLLALGGCSVTLGQSTPSGPPTVIPVKVLRGQDRTVLVLVPITIGGHGPYDFVLDTGASVSLIDQALAQRLGLDSTGTDHSVSGIGGTVQVTFVAVKSWQMGRLTLPAAQLGSGQLPGDQHDTMERGLLGSDILSQFGAITVNYDSSTLTVAHALAA
jgi:predicted aspartyl protease